MLTLLRNATLVGLSSNSKSYLDVPSDERERLETLCQQSGTDILVRAFHVMLDVHDLVARSNRPRLVLEMAVARLVSIRPAQPIDRLLHRLDHLEQRIRDAGGVVIAPARDQARPRSSDDDKESSPPVETPASSAAEEEGVTSEPERSDVVEMVPPSEDVCTEAAEAQEPKGPVASPETISVMDETVSKTDTDESKEDDSEPTVDPDAIPEIPDDLPDHERFASFRAWLEAGGARYEIWAQDCIFVSASPPFLHLEFSKGFRLKHVSFSLKDERLLRGIEAFFPGCTQVKVKDRDESTGRLTHRENVAKEAAEAQMRLEDLIRSDADIQKIASHFDASIRSVHADYRAPVPPALLPKED